MKIIFYVVRYKQKKSLKKNDFIMINKHKIVSDFYIISKKNNI